MLNMLIQGILSNLNLRTFGAIVLLAILLISAYLVYNKFKKPKKENYQPPYTQEAAQNQPLIDEDEIIENEEQEGEENA